MNTIIRRFLPVLLTALLCACGPREISGVGETEDRESSSTAEQMRYPLYGTDATQRMLYRNNLASTMVYRQSVIENSLRNPEPGQKAPRERCPFLE